MMLRNKILAIIGLTLAGLLIVLSFFSRMVLLRNFARLEEQDARHNLERARSALWNELTNLDHSASDYASWDQTYHFLSGTNPGYPQRELPDDTFERLRLSMVLLANNAGRVVISRGYDWNRRTAVPVPVSVHEKLRLLLVSHAKNGAVGVLLLPEGPMLVSARPVLTSRNAGPARGTLVMARRLDASETAKLRDLTHLDIAITPYAGTTNAPGTPGRSSELSAAVEVRVQDDNTIAGSQLIRDIYGQPALTLAVSLPREIYREGQASLVDCVLLFMAICLVFGAIVLYLLEHVVLSEITGLSSSVASIGSQGDLSARIVIRSHDELAQLAASINGMLEALEKSQLEAQDREARLRLLIGQMPAILWTADTELRITSSLGSGLTALNLKQSELVGTSIREFYKNDTSRPSLQAHQRALEGEVVTYENRLRERVFHAHVEPLRNAEGTVTGTIGVALDITELKAAEEALGESQQELKNSEQRFRSLVLNSSDMITVLDAHGSVAYESPSVERVLGYKAGELIGKSIFEFVHPDDVAVAETIFHEELRVAGASRLMEVRFRHKHGSWRILESVANNLLQDPGVAGVVVNSRDITERKNLEQQLHQSQKMEAVGRLAGGIAHDFNNLLTIINGHSEVQVDHLAPEDPMRKNAEEIQKAVARAAALVRQLLAFSRKQIAQPVVLDLNETVVETGKMLPRLIGEDIDLVMALAPNLARIKADPVQLDQILLNLAVNARDAMPGGGKLTVETGEVSWDEAHCAQNPGCRPGMYVSLAVTDTGSGMDRETQSRIFEPFFTTKEKGKGTGLGLATVYGIVKQNGGHISVSSEPGRGTTFRIYFPEVAGSKPVPKQSPDEFQTLPRGSETILVAEDEQSLREIVSGFLTRSGYRVLYAKDGLEALQICEQYADPIHLLISDMVMPRMGGRELGERVAKLRPETTILFTSGYTGETQSPDNDNGEFSIPENAFLGKPFSLQTLALKVRTMLDQRKEQGISAGAHA